VTNPTTATTDRRARVDWYLLGMELDAACARRLVSLRKAAHQMRVPVSGLSNLRHGGKLSADAVARLVAWLYPRSVPAWITHEETPS
jgi:hypothetical protein